MWQFEIAAPPFASVNPSARPVAVSAGSASRAGSAVAPPAQIANGPLDAELVQLYALCPEAAVVSLDEVVHSPEKVNARVPPVRLTAAQVPNASSESLQTAIPHILYPKPLRIASRPEPPTPIASTTPGDWLVDPKEWLGEEKNRPADVAPPAASSAVPPTNPEPPASTNDAPIPPPPPAEAIAAPTAEGSPIQRGQMPVGEPESPAAEPSSLPPANTAESPAATEEVPPAAPETQPAAPVTETVAPVAQPVAPAAQPAAPPFAPPQLPSESPAGTQENKDRSAVDPHLELFAKNCYPSARECAKCHEETYEQWSISAHAYANVSPMFHKFEQKFNDLSQGTVGYFCLRCHAPVATAMCASRDEPVWNLPEVGREGVTCLACHRVQYMYGKSNGERRIEPGPIFAPVLGGIAGDGVADAIAHKEQFKVKTSPDDKAPGQDIHVTGICFEQISRSEFCTPCHQVAVVPGIKLEVVYDQYRASPACKKGIQCQDCHMGRVPGLPLGYEVGAVAKVAGKTVNDNRKKPNHIFYGPNYSIAHPGVFPFNLKASRWSMQDWLAFDWRAGWGTEAFENQVADGKLAADFPPVWKEADDRRDAREIIEVNLKKLEHKREIRQEIMENGSRVDGPVFDTQPCRGQELKFHVVMTNTNEGHNLLTASLGAQPQLWANIVLIGPDGRRLWETGYTDSFGDLANIHSEDVRHKNLAFDWQLFNLQTMFLITGATGTDREFYVPVNLDIDQLPFARPGTQPITVLNHPPFIRMESQSLAATGSRRIPYRIPGELLQQAGTYRLSFRLRNRAEPMYLMRFCEATLEMQRSMNEWMIDLHPISVEFVVP
jgi:hypothetical protein